MTTIVYRDGVMAADSRLQRSDWILPGSAVKVYRRADGALIGMTGGASGGNALAQWVLDGLTGDQPKADDASALVVTPDGKIMVYEQGAGHEIKDTPFFAIGSGFPVALGALAMGASAADAVRIAARHDPCTGGEVVSVRHT